MAPRTYCGIKGDARFTNGVILTSENNNNQKSSPTLFKTIARRVKIVCPIQYVLSMDLNHANLCRYGHRVLRKGFLPLHDLSPSNTYYNHESDSEVKKLDRASNIQSWLRG
jgi:hypothetical protein